MQGVEYPPMVATILAVNWIGVEGGAKLENWIGVEVGGARSESQNRRGEIFVAWSCHIITEIFKVLQESLPTRFFQKKTGGNFWGGPPNIVRENDVSGCSAGS
jgi:hypothetical protein